MRGDEPEEAKENKLSPAVLVALLTAEAACPTKQLEEERVYSGSLCKGTVHHAGEVQRKRTVPCAGGDGRRLGSYVCRKQ